MSNRIWWIVIIGLGVVIIGGLIALVVIPAPVHAPTATSTPATTTSPQQAVLPSTSTAASSSEPLHARVIVSEPKSGATVGKTFMVRGEAPGNWYFEASFPIKVIDPSYNTIGVSHGQAQSDWMTTKQVPFIANVTIGANYSGPATLVLLRDNPSGLPQNDDSLEIPIVIQ